MARLARVVIPGHPHHVTQRGNGRARTFFEDGDYALYRDLLAANCEAAGVEVWAWCLMPSHVHLILVPSDPDGLRRALARVHRSYAGTIQARRKRSGHFWQGRFGAVAMDERHLAMVFKLVEGAQKSWRRLDGHNQLPKLILGVTFSDGIEVIAKPTDRQPTTAAA